MYLIKKNANTVSPKVPALFDDFISQELFNWGKNNFVTGSSSVPSVNIKETEANFELELAAPGLDKKDFQIKVEDDILSISSSKQHKEESESYNYTRREFSYVSFERNFKLPKEIIDEQSISAKYENGVLQILIPKKEVKQKLSKQIEIR